jgi:predicted ArsR family transcriptional regulator
MTERRGVAEADLIQALGLAESAARALLDALAAEGRIRRVEFEGRPHYHRT